ncbi:MAG: hypothetical protein JNK05_37935 [Myxococcales bacterium]|nr:hypothetical protein [Myxococcales bacterium]
MTSISRVGAASAVPGIERTEGVGWAIRDALGTSPPIDRAFVEKLVELFAAASKSRNDGPVMMGVLTCSACVLTRGPDWMTLFDQRIEVRTTTLLVPANTFVYFVSAMVLHAMDAHSFVPSQEFVQATLACETPGSARYLMQLRRAGGGEYVSRVLLARKLRSRAP